MLAVQSRTKALEDTAAPGHDLAATAVKLPVRHGTASRRVLAAGRTSAAAAHACVVHGTLTVGAASLSAAFSTPVARKRPHSPARLLLYLVSVSTVLLSLQLESCVGGRTSVEPPSTRPQPS